MTSAVQLSGGLGNQLFQLCFAHSLHTHTSEKILLDISLYNPISSRQLSDLILIPNESYEIGTFLDRRDVFPRLRHKHTVDVKVLSSKTNKVERSRTLKVFNEDYRQFVPNLQELDDTYFIGTFASHKYWLSGFHATIEWVKDIILEKKLSVHQSTYYDLSVHARRGDYVDNPKTRAFHGYCGTPYYQEAFRAVKDKESLVKSVIISSDDLAYANELANIARHFFAKVTVLNENSDLETLVQLGQSRSFIGSNSTFSWWAGYLFPKDILIFPRKWYVSERVKFSADLLFPDSPTLINIELSR